MSKLTSPSPAVLARLNVQVIGDNNNPTLLFCNGFNCNQQVWRYLVPTLKEHYQLVLFDQVGTGCSDITAYDSQKYATLAGHAQDVLEICEALNLRDTALVGHSAGAMIALLASIQAPQYFTKAVLLAASPCYLNEPDYYGGFERQDVEDLLTEMGKSYHTWANMFAIMMIGQEYSSSLGYELASYFCESDPEIARRSLRYNFFSDYRPELSKMPIPVLLLQCREDAAVPAEVNSYLVQHLPQATLVILSATGHCPHMSAPFEVLAAIEDFV